MKNLDGYKRGFSRNSKGWCAEAVGPELSIDLGMYHEEGHSCGEMTLKWVELGSENDLVPQLCASDGSWSVLSMFHDLISAMAQFDDESISEEQFSVLLLRLGFDDMTQYVNPNEPENELKAARESMSTSSASPSENIMNTREIKPGDKIIAEIDGEQCSGILVEIDGDMLVDVIATHRVPVILRYLLAWRYNVIATHRVPVSAVTRLIDKHDIDPPLKVPGNGRR